MAKLEFPADKVKADAEAEANIAQIVNDVAAAPDGRFLITRNGNPSVVIVNVDYIENLLGDKVGNPMPAARSMPEPTFPPAPPPSVTDFMSRNAAQPVPPQEVQEKPPLEPPAVSDFQPLISPPLASEVPGSQPSGPMPEPNPLENPVPPPMQPAPPSGPQPPGHPLPPPPPMPPPPPVQPGPPFLGNPQQ